MSVRVVERITGCDFRPIGEGFYWLARIGKAVAWRNFGLHWVSTNGALALSRGEDIGP